MWPVAPAHLCDQHLRGEHFELHMIVGALIGGKTMTGFYTNGLVDTGLIISRHAALAAEMEQRGMVHKSPLSEFVDPHLGWLDPKAEMVLMERCEQCRERSTL